MRRVELLCKQSYYTVYTYVLDILWGQQIKIIHAGSNSEF